MESHIEQSLVTQGIISQEQLATLKLEQQRSSISLINAIRRLKFVRETVLLDFLEQKKIKPIIAQRFPLAEARQAHELLGKGGVVGKIVLVPNGAPRGMDH